GPEDRSLGCVAAGQKVGRCQVARGLECRRLELGPKFIGGTSACEFSSDGQRLVSAHNDGARIWDLATRTQVMFLPDRDVRGAAFAPGGGSVFTCAAGGTKKWPLERETLNEPEHAGASAAFGDYPAENLALIDDGRTLVLNPRGKMLLLDTDSRE